MATYIAIHQARTLENAFIKRGERKKKHFPLLKRNDKNGTEQKGKINGTESLNHSDYLRVLSQSE